MSYSPVGDTVALTKLAYNVYNKVYTVARDAPQQFAELSQDLKIFKAVLHHINKQLVRDTDQQYGAPVKDVLERCFRTLRGLRELTSKYENLGKAPLSGEYCLRMLIILEHRMERSWSLVEAPTVCCRSRRH